MEYSYFDIVVSVIVLLLGLKGIINGFFKELFGFVGIIGGIFVASRVGDSVGQYISDLIFKFESSASVNFTGFLVTLALFWAFMILAGIIFKKLSSLSGLGILDRILGFVFAASKFFLIAAVIAYATYNIKSMRTTIDSTFENSFMFPMLVETGSVIMKLDPIEISDDINATIEKGTKAVEEKIKKSVDTTSNETIKEAVEKIQNSVDKNNSNTVNK